MANIRDNVGGGRAEGVVVHKCTTAVQTGITLTIERTLECGGGGGEGRLRAASLR